MKFSHRSLYQITLLFATEPEIARAKHIIDEYEKADIHGGLGAIVIDDQMVDATILRVEWKKLAIVRKAGLA